MRRETRNNLILLFVSLVISLLLFEIGLRVFENYKYRYFISEEHNGSAHYKVNPNCRVILQGQSFLKNKPENTYRIFTFGGSTTEGAIHDGKISFTKFLDWKLKELLPSINIEIINFGKSGEASRHVLEKAKKALRYNPDLLIIYTGHNEFLRFDERTAGFFGQMSEVFDNSYIYKRSIEKVFNKFIDRTSLYFIETRKLEDNAIGSLEEFEKTREEYKRNIEKIVKMARDSKVDIILSNEIGNYQGWEPNRSVHYKHLDENAMREWQYHFHRGKKFMEEKKIEAAIKEFEFAKQIDPTFAELNYQLAKAYEASALWDNAKKEYRNAADNDGDPKIASSLFDKFIEETCLKYKIPCLKVLQAFEGATENSLIGFNFMEDAHHPSISGELLIAKEIVRVMAEHSLPVPAQHWSFENDKPDEWYLDQTVLTYEDEVAFHQNRGLWFAKLSTRRYDPEDRLKRAGYHFGQAYKLNPNDYKTYIGFAVMALLNNNHTQSNKHIQRACALNSSGTTLTFKELWIRNLFLKNKINIDKTCKFQTM